MTRITSYYIAHVLLLLIGRPSICYGVRWWILAEWKPRRYRSATAGHWLMLAGLVECLDAHNVSVTERLVFLLLLFFLTRPPSLLSHSLSLLPGRLCRSSVRCRGSCEWPGRCSVRVLGDATTPRSCPTSSSAPTSIRLLPFFPPLHPVSSISCCAEIVMG